MMSFFGQRIVNFSQRRLWCCTLLGADTVKYGGFALLVNDLYAPWRVQEIDHRSTDREGGKHDQEDFHDALPCSFDVLKGLRVRDGGVAVQPIIKTKGSPCCIKAQLEIATASRRRFA